MTALSRVFQSVKIGNLELVNRIVMSSMHLNLDGPGLYEQYADFYRRRAEGGPGLIVTSGCSPDACGKALPNDFAIDHDALVDEHRKLTRAVHSAGDSKLALQLLHCGREALHGHLVAPSPLRAIGSLFEPRELSAEEIEEIILAYGRAAVRAVAAGYDAVELVFSQGFLPHQFLSSDGNRRQDQWGGGWEYRKRFCVQLARSVRDAVGDEYPLIFRVPCLDLKEGGLTHADGLDLISDLLASDPQIINVGIGRHDASHPTISWDVPVAAFVGVADSVKQHFPDKIVCVSNRIHDLRIAEAVLEDSSVDLVAMGRAFLADARIVSKSKSGRFNEVNRCIACNQECMDSVFQARPVSCALDPDAVVRLGEQPEALEGKHHCAVVGGGVAGMSCALELARHGSKVTLFEEGVALGGQMLAAAKIPQKSEYGYFVEYLVGQLHRAGVQVRLSTRFDADNAEPYDHVFLACGARPRHLDARVDERVQLIPFDALLRDDLPVQYPVAIIGAGGVAIDVTKYLLERHSALRGGEAFLASVGVSLAQEVRSANECRNIAMIQRSSRRFGYRLSRTAQKVAGRLLQDERVSFHPGCSVQTIGADGVTVVDRGGVESTIPAKTVIVAAGQVPDRRLSARLMECGIPFTEVGSVASNVGGNRLLASSVRSGVEAARAFLNLGSLHDV